MRTDAPTWHSTVCNSLLSATIQCSSPTSEARVTARGQEPEFSSRNGEGAPSCVRAVQCPILTPDF